MISFIERKQKTLSCRILNTFIAFTFILSMVVPPRASYAQAVPQTVLNLPIAGTMIAPSAGYVPLILKAVTVNPSNPMEFNFIVDTGHSRLDGEALREESTKLIKYFLASLTTPESELWVNLSPYEKNRVIPASFGQTEMGRDLLAQDYMLKQLTASLMFPENELGNTFWKRVKAKAQKLYGTTDIPLNTFSKVWIVPEKASVYENGTTAFVVHSKLKVMLEEDYVALTKNKVNEAYALDQIGAEDQKIISGVTSEVIREVLIPELEREVNEGKTFANLRQIFNSMILATWYKNNLRQSLLGQIYVDQNKTKGINVDDLTITQKIYNQYVEAFKTGVYDFIREDYDPATQHILPRKYFSGGVVGSFAVAGGVTELSERTLTPAVARDVTASAKEVGRYVSLDVLGMDLGPDAADDDTIAAALKSAVDNSAVAQIDNGFVVADAALVAVADIDNPDPAKTRADQVGILIQRGTHDRKVLVGEQKSAQTGALYIPDGIAAGANGVLAGHSETRLTFDADGKYISGFDTNETVNAQLLMGHQLGLKDNVLAIGETLIEYDGRRTEEIVLRDLTTGLNGLTAEQVGRTIVAYEPRWAIGSGKTPTAAEALAIEKLIREKIREIYGDDAANKVRILYGGSAKPANMRDFLRSDTVERGYDGFLIGGAALQVDSFAAMLNIAAEVGATQGRAIYMGANWKADQSDLSPANYRKFAEIISKLDPRQVQVGIAPIASELTKLKDAVNYVMPDARKLLRHNLEEQKAFADSVLNTAQAMEEPIVRLLTERTGIALSEVVSTRSVLVSSNNTPLVPTVRNGIIHVAPRNSTHILRTSDDRSGIVLAAPLKTGRTIDSVSVVLPLWSIDEAKIRRYLVEQLQNETGKRYIIEDLESTTQLQKDGMAANTVVISNLSFMPVEGKPTGSRPFTQVNFRLIYDTGSEVASPPIDKPIPLPDVTGSLKQSSLVKTPDPSNRVRPTNFALNGYGRIGALFLAHMLKHENSAKNRVVVINARSADLIRQKLLNDTVHGPLLDPTDEIKVGEDQTGEFVEIYLAAKGETHKIYVVNNRGPASNLPWEEFGVDIVFDAVTKKSESELTQHIDAGAQMAILTAPGKKGADGQSPTTTVLGTVTQDLLEEAVKRRNCSEGSCTTGSMAAILNHLITPGGSAEKNQRDLERAKRLRYTGQSESEEKTFDLLATLLTTFHALTASDTTVDSSDRLATTAGEANIGSTGASKALAEIFPSLKGRMDAHSIRVTQANGSLTTIQTTVKIKSGKEADYTREKVIAQLQAAAAHPDAAGVIGVDDVFSNAEIIGRSESGILVPSTVQVKIVDDPTDASRVNRRRIALITFAVWYDNEWGFAARTSDTAQIFANELATKLNQANDTTELLNARELQGAIAVSAEESQGTSILDSEKLLEDGGALDYLVREASQSSNANVRAAAQRVLREVRVASGITAMSLSDVQAARKKNELQIDIPAYTATDDLLSLYWELRDYFRAAKENAVGLAVINLKQPSADALINRPEYRDGYAAVVTALANAAAVKERYTGKFVYFHLDLKVEPGEFDYLREEYNTGNLPLRLIAQVGASLTTEAKDAIRAINTSQMLFDQFTQSYAYLLRRLDGPTGIPEGEDRRLAVDAVKKSMQDAVNSGVYNFNLDLSAFIDTSMQETVRELERNVTTQIIKAVQKENTDGFYALELTDIDKLGEHSENETNMVRQARSFLLSYLFTGKKDQWYTESSDLPFIDIEAKKLAGQIQLLRRLYQSNNQAGSEVANELIRFTRAQLEQVTDLGATRFASPILLNMTLGENSNTIETQVFKDRVNAQANRELLAGTESVAMTSVNESTQTVSTSGSAFLKELVKRARANDKRALRLVNQMTEFMEVLIYSEGQGSPVVRGKLAESNLLQTRGADDFAEERKAWQKLFQNNLGEGHISLLETNNRIVAGEEKNYPQLDKLRALVLSAFHAELWEMFALADSSVTDHHIYANTTVLIERTDNKGRQEDVERVQRNRYRDRRGIADPLPAGRRVQDNYLHERGDIVEPSSRRPEAVQKAVVKAALNRELSPEELAEPVEEIVSPTDQRKLSVTPGDLDATLKRMDNKLRRSDRYNDANLLPATNDADPQANPVERILARFIAKGYSEKYIANLRRLYMTGVLAGTGTALFLPIDQGIEHDPFRTFVPNPDSASKWWQVQRAHEFGMNGFAAPVQTIREVAPIWAQHIPLIAKVNSSTSNGGNNKEDQHSAMSGNIAELAALGVSAIGFTIYPGSGAWDAQEAELKFVIEESKKHGLPVIVWSYPRGTNVTAAEETGLDVELAAALRAHELGAAIIKIKPPANVFRNASIRRWLEDKEVPTKTLAERFAIVRHLFPDLNFVFSGGSTASEEKVLLDIASIHIGARGLTGGAGHIMGRNHFQRTRSEAMRLTQLTYAIARAYSRRPSWDSAEELVAHAKDVVYPEITREMGLSREAPAYGPDIIPSRDSRGRTAYTKDQTRYSTPVEQLIAHRHAADPSALQENLRRVYNHGVLGRSGQLMIVPLTDPDQLLVDGVANAYSAPINTIRSLRGRWTNAQAPLLLEIGPVEVTTGVPADYYNQPSFRAQIDEVAQLQSVAGITFRLPYGATHHNSYMAQLQGLIDYAKSKGLPVITVADPSSENSTKLKIANKRSFDTVTAALGVGIETGSALTSVPLSNNSFQSPAAQKALNDRSIPYATPAERIAAMKRFGGFDNQHTVPVTLNDPIGDREDFMREIAGTLIGGVNGFIIPRGSEVANDPQLVNDILTLTQINAGGKYKTVDTLLQAADRALVANRTDDAAPATDATTRYGGINLNPALFDLQIKRDGNGIALPMNQQIITDIHIEGILPVIINVTPITPASIPLLSKILDRDSDTNTNDFSYSPDLDSIESKDKIRLREPEQVSMLN